MTGEGMKKGNVRQWALVAVPVLLTAGVMTFFRACGAKEDGSWMHCHEVQQYLAAAGALLTLIAVAALFVSGTRVCVLLRLAGLILSVVSVLLQGTIMKMCMMDTMRCYAVMRPFAWVMGGLSAVLSLLDLIGQIRSSAGTRP